MKYKKILFYETRVGIFYIAQSPDGHFFTFLNSERFGEKYPKVWHATEALAEEEVIPSPETGEIVDGSKLGIPETPEEWTRIV